MDLSILSLEYTVAPKQNVQFRYWAGALLRNNLLYAAADVPVDGSYSLLQVIQQTDPLLPRGYALQCDPFLEPVSLTSNDVFRFRIQLFGRFSAYAEHFHNAVQAMCKRGFGHPLAPMSILACSTYRNGVAIGTHQPQHTVDLAFITPASIYNGRAMPQARQTSLDMQNGMPGLYFTLRSLVRRINKLQYAYEDSLLWNDTQVEEWCRDARKAQLEECSLSRLILEGPPRKNTQRPIYFKGYVGHAVYSQLADKYLPLLYIGMQTNVGNDTVYGLGQYRINIL